MPWGRLAVCAGLVAATLVAGATVGPTPVEGAPQPAATATFTSSLTHFASLTVLADDTNSTATDARTNHINESGQANWRYVDGTRMLEREVFRRSQSGPIGSPTYVFDKRPDHVIPKEFDHLYSWIYDPVLDDFVENPDLRPVVGSGDDRLPGSGGIITRVTIYDTSGAKVPDAAFRMELLVKTNSSATFEVIGDPSDTTQVGGYSPVTTKPHLELFHCNPQDGDTCTSVAGTELVGGANPVNDEYGGAVFHTNSQGDAYVWVGEKNSNLDTMQIRVLDYRDGDTRTTNRSDDRTFIAVGDQVTNGYPDRNLTRYDFATPGAATIAAMATSTITNADQQVLSQTAPLALSASENFRSIATVRTVAASCLWGATLVDPTGSTFEVASDSITADGTSTTTFTATVTNRCWTGLSGQTVTIDVPNADGTYSTLTGTTNSSGVVTFTVTAPSTPGSDTVTAYIGGTDGTQIAEPVSVAFVAGPMDPEQSSVTVDEEEILADGSSVATVTATLLDAQGNPVAPGTPVCLDLGDDSGTLSSGPWETDENGQVTATLTSPTVAGSSTITATVGACDAAPVATVGSVDVAFVPGPPDGGQSTIEIDDEVLTADGVEAATVTVTVRDANGNTVPAGQAVCLQLTDGTGTLSAGPWTTDENGQVTATLTSPTSVGSGTVTGSIGGCDSIGDEIGSVDADYVPGPMDPEQSSVTVDDELMPADDTSTTVTANLRDAQGNPITEGTEVCLAVTGGDGEIGEGPWYTDADGNVTTPLSSIVVGTTTVTATLGSCDGEPGTTVGSVDVEFVAAPPFADESDVTVDDDEMPADGTPTTVRAVLRNRLGDPIDEGVEVCVEVVDGPGELGDGPWSTGPGGTLAVPLGSTSAGTGRVVVYAGSCDDKGPEIGAVEVEFVPGPAAGDESDIGLDRQELPGDGRSTALVTVTVRDQFGNPVAPGTEVCLQITEGSGTLSSGPWSTDADGTVSAVLTAPDVGGQATISGFLGSCAAPGERVGSLPVTYVVTELPATGRATWVLVALASGVLALGGGLRPLARRRVRRI